MGGTSFDVSLIANGEAALAAQTSIDFGVMTDEERARVREIVHGHAGEVWAYSGEGRLGFRLTLPVAGAPPRAAPATEPPARSSKRARPTFDVARDEVGSGAGEGDPDGVEDALADRPLYHRSSVRPWPWRDGGAPG